MVTAIIDDVKHYFLNGEWFYDDRTYLENEELEKKPMWRKGPISLPDEINHKDCHRYEELILDAYQLQERLMKARKEYDCTDLSNAIRRIKESIHWMTEALFKFSPPSTEINQE